MGFKVPAAAALSLLVAAVAVAMVGAADPELLTDFQLPPNVSAASELDGNFFTFTGLREDSPNGTEFATVRGANSLNFPAVIGLGVSYARLTFPPGSVNRPHTHPRGTEAFFVVEGTIDVGLVDSAENLFTQTLQKGDIFVFPRGLVHFQINWDPKVTVQAIGAFSSANAGTIVLPRNIFGSGINWEVLARSFGVSQDVIKQLVAAQPPPPNAA